jgi:hypothetical protein
MFTYVLISSMNFTPPPHPHSDGFADAISADPGQGGEATVAERSREVRRLQRVLVLGRARDVCGELIDRINDGTAGRLPENQQYLFDKVADPYLALSRTVTALGRIVVLEARLDESAETRDARLAAEAAEREKTRLAEQARENRQRLEAALETKKAHIRRAVDMAHRDAEPDMRPIDRITKLDDLFEEFDDYADWDGDSVAIVADLCTQLGLHAPLPKGSEKQGGTGRTDPNPHLGYRGMLPALDRRQRSRRTRRASCPAGPGPGTARPVGTAGSGHFSLDFLSCVRCRRFPPRNGDAGACACLKIHHEGTKGSALVWGALVSFVALW